ncbi:hypothetical protein D3C71_33870 [compost metagenome]
MKRSEKFGSHRVKTIGTNFLLQFDFKTFLKDILIQPTHKIITHFLKVIINVISS